MNKLLGKVEEGAKKLANHQVWFFMFFFFFLFAGDVVYDLEAGHDDDVEGGLGNICWQIIRFLFCVISLIMMLRGWGAKNLSNHQVCFLFLFVSLYGDVFFCTFCW